MPKKEADPFGKTRLSQRHKNAILRNAEHGKEKYFQGDLAAAKFENQFYIEKLKNFKFL